MRPMLALHGCVGQPRHVPKQSGVLLCRSLPESASRATSSSRLADVTCSLGAARVSGRSNRKSIAMSRKVHLAPSSTLDGYDRWADTYDQIDNPMVAATTWSLAEVPLELAGLRMENEI